MKRLSCNTSTLGRRDMLVLVIALWSWPHWGQFHMFPVDSSSLGGGGVETGGRGGGGGGQVVIVTNDYICPVGFVVQM